MKQLLNLFTVLFGIMSGLFMLNRFYDLLEKISGNSTLSIAAYCSHALLILVLGLILFAKKGNYGFWLLLIWEVYLIITHALEFNNYMNTYSSLPLPEGMRDMWTIPYYNVIFLAEMVFGFSAVVLLVKINRQRVANEAVGNKGD